MDFSQIFTLVAALVQGNLPGFFAGLAAGLLPFLVGGGMAKLITFKWVQKALGIYFQACKVWGQAIGLWAEAGPLKTALLPLAFLLMLIGFGIMCMLDALISKLDVHTQAFLNAAAGALKTWNSEDRFTYVASKLTPAPPPEPTAAEKMAAAVAAPPAPLAEPEAAVLLAANAAGAELQTERAAP